MKSLHLGKKPPRLDILGSIFAPLSKDDFASAVIERQIAKSPGSPFAAEAAGQQAAKDKVSKELGVTFANGNAPVTPVEKSAAPTAEEATDKDTENAKEGKAPAADLEGSESTPSSAADRDA